ncbi:MAG: hypothetical protein F6J87_16280 [Spirulina sp. SIO3F2]|nr:hypothetical protein [Spirulina sp. SIO3F2]
MSIRLNHQPQQFLRLRHRPKYSHTLLTDLLKENPFERLGRFKWVRHLYSDWQALKQRNAHKLPKYWPPHTKTVFVELGADFINRAIAGLQHNAITPGLSLPRTTTTAILNYARSSLCYEPGRSTPFRIDEVKQVQLQNTKVFRGLVEHPEHCPEIQCLVRDPLLLTVVQRYLRYWPTQITTHLTWSIPTTLPLAEVQKFYPPTRYHYDIAGFNFMTAYFYITPVTRIMDGAHIMIPGTHRHKPFALMFSGSHSEQTIERYFGLSKAVPILGDAGFGFIQDPSCIHRLHPPALQNRLLLQIRYS